MRCQGKSGVKAIFFLFVVVLGFVFVQASRAYLSHLAMQEEVMGLVSADLLQPEADLPAALETLVEEYDGEINGEDIEVEYSSARKAAHVRFSYAIVY